MPQFQESELILTEDGAVYHLNLKPHEIAETIILVGDKDRVPVVSSFFDKIEVKKEKREFFTHTGWYHGKKISVISTGIGTDNIDIVLNELDALCNIDLTKREQKLVHKSQNIIRIGTCGAIQPDIPVESFVVSEFGFGLDNLMSFYRYDLTANEKNLIRLISSHLESNQIKLPFYLTEASAELRKLFSSEFFSGITITAPGFYAPQGRKLRYDLAYANLIDVLSCFSSGNLRMVNFEMETSALFGLSKILGHKAITVDLVLANRAQKLASIHYHDKMKELIKKVLEIIRVNDVFTGEKA